jgi:hypothetical protein
MEYSQVVRHRFLVPACKGSNPFTPDYEHPIGFVKNELTTTGEAARARDNSFPGMMLQYFIFFFFSYIMAVFINS